MLCLQGFAKQPTDFPRRRHVLRFAAVEKAVSDRHAVNFFFKNDESEPILDLEMSTKVNLVCLLNRYIQHNQLTVLPTSIASLKNLRLL